MAIGFRNKLATQRTRKGEGTSATSSVEGRRPFVLRKYINRFGIIRGVQYAVTKSGANRDADLRSFCRLADTAYDRPTKRPHGDTFNRLGGWD
jgi:hypothetical protein